MIENLSNGINLFFILTVIITIWLFYKVTKKSSYRSLITLILILIWTFAQSIIGYSLFYTNTNTIPPRFIFLAAPPVILIIALFVTKGGKIFIDSLSLKEMTLLQIVRVPVEITLYLLFINGFVPELMTFAGRNFDILAGLTAPVITYLGFNKKTISSRFVMIWNIICLGLVINIVVNAVLSAPFPFQRFAFEQPNIAILYFPYNLLPGCIVPVVIFCHLASIRQLIKLNKKN